MLKSITLNEWAVAGGVILLACLLYAVTLPARSKRASGAS
jgi:hypothetical protein